MKEEPVEFWTEMASPPPDRVLVGGTALRAGDRVRLRPRRGGDVLDRVLAGRVAVLEGIDEDETGGTHVAVVLEQDPGRDLGEARMPGHRFYFTPAELEPIPPRVLVAGVGNVFLGDDGFGPAVVRRLLQDGPDLHGDVRDFGIRGMDLAFSLERYDVAILVDLVSRGEAPGTLLVIDATDDAGRLPSIDTHGMSPAKVLALARALGRVPHRVLVVGCEPKFVPEPGSEDVTAELSAPVADAVDRAAEEVRALLREVLETDGGA